MVQLVVAVVVVNEICVFVFVVSFCAIVSVSAKRASDRRNGEKRREFPID